MCHHTLLWIWVGYVLRCWFYYRFGDGRYPVISLLDLLHQARTLLAERDAILDRYESHADLVESLTSRLEEAERDLQASIDCRSDMEEVLAEIRQELESRPEATGEDVREVLGALAAIVEDREYEGDGDEF
jgi:hypothetical protein